MTETKETASKIMIEDDRTGITIETLKRAILDNLFYIQGKYPEIATLQDCYQAIAYTVRDRLLNRWLHTTETYLKNPVKMVGYLSAEFLTGPHLGNNLINLGIYEPIRQAVSELGWNLENLLEQEEEPGLGNGGLGRLAACYMDSLATLEIPTIGYGIRYEFGIFDQEIKEGWQWEITDKWLRYGNPWEMVRPEASLTVKLGGHTESYFDQQGRYRVQWIPDQEIKGVPSDTPILGYKTNTANTLRLWKAEAIESFNFHAFNAGHYFDAVAQKIDSENITKVLYPNDETIQGKQLRLEQEYFFVSCSLQDVLRIHLQKNQSLQTLPDYFSLQLNDTHPAIAVAELMRLLVDEHFLEWEESWSITVNTLAYTNHTLLPEALEQWSIDLLQWLLPRHLQIIYEINRRFLEEVGTRYPEDSDRLKRVSIIDESGERQVRMAHLATLGSHRVNGVAQLHTTLLKEDVLADFAQLYPDKFTNKTNGVSPRRFMALSNPRLTQLITEKIGDSWLKDLTQLQRLETFVDQPQFQSQWVTIKQAVKQDLANFIQENYGIKINPLSLFDIQTKRIHEYKRQHLNIFHLITLYLKMKANPYLDVPPRTFIFGGKATPGCFMAKLIIKLIHSVADVINNDPDIGDRLKVIFLKNYNVKLAQKIYPAADLSEQISLAGKEASGTGNMKFSLNGALTIGTLDGANVEIRDAVGEDNFFLFGLTSEEVYGLKAGDYNPWYYYHNHPCLKEVIDHIASGYFSQGDREIFRPLIDDLMSRDDYLLLVDYPFYVECQEKVGKTYQNQKQWTRMSILNVARMGYFSSDRAIQEYCQEIWRVKPIPIDISSPL